MYYYMGTKLVNYQPGVVCIRGNALFCNTLLFDYYLIIDRDILFEWSSIYKSYIPLILHKNYDRCITSKVTSLTIFFFQKRLLH